MKRVILTGCSGGGKSTLLSALAAEGYRTVPEPGRRIVEAEVAAGGDVLPWANPVAFANRCLALALDDHSAADGDTIYDRSLIDALCNLERLGSPHARAAEIVADHPYDEVFAVPPWSDIFTRDAARRHGFAEAVAEYEALGPYYARCGHDWQVLDRAPVAERAAVVVRALAS